ncbi:MAG: pentapeptide repeat-containing protein [Candidatus Brocadiae bacterium]|nr:pentapeptide repeat-containing protein [Candidatus Brocadiia bacterium]
MNFDKFNLLQAEKPNLREMADATAIGDYRNSGCGDAYRIFLRVSPSGVIEDASFTTTGCGFGLAALSLCCEAAKGKTLDEAAKLTVEEVERGIEGFPDRRKNYPASALEALQVAIANQRDGGAGAARGAKPTREQVLRMVAASESLGALNGAGLDLSGLDLRAARFDGGDFAGADFSGCWLMGASFAKCSLRGAKFRGADLCGANLRRADLYNADCRGADFSHADLRNSFLNDSDLTGATFVGANLGFCKLTGVIMEGTRWAGAFCDAMTRFDPGLVAPLDVMFHRDPPGEMFLKEEARP